MKDSFSEELESTKGKQAAKHAMKNSMESMDSGLGQYEDRAS